MPEYECRIYSDNPISVHTSGWTKETAKSSAINWLQDNVCSLTGASVMKVECKEVDDF